VSQPNSNGTVTQTTYTPGGKAGGPAVKAPNNPSTTGFSYWDGISETDYYRQPPFITAPPNPQIAVGPDDVLTIVNRTIARYPNQNAQGAPTVTNPYNNPPTEAAWLDVWTGIPILSGDPIGSNSALCPSGTSNNNICVIDNASIRYDQMQGRFVVLYTVTDMLAHRSNFVLVVSKFAQFTKCSSAVTPPATCPTSSPLFTPPVIAPIVGGTQTGGFNTANWVAYIIPINVTYVGSTPPPGAAAGANLTTGPQNLGFGIAGVANSVATAGGTLTNFDTTQFCANGGPTLPLTNGVGGTTRTCTNYFPTAARMGLDNDNIILTAPVLDQMGSSQEGTLVGQNGNGGNGGPYVGTRVVSISKAFVYNGTALNLTTQPPACVTASGGVASANTCSAVNLSDNLRTGTLTEGGFPAGNPWRVTGVAPTAANLCSAVIQAIGTCAPTAAQLGLLNPIEPIFWEPDNLRGRALASFDSQVAPAGTPAAGVITPVDYLVGSYITNLIEAANSLELSMASQYFIQPIAYTCPGSSNGLASLAFCLTANLTAQSPDLPALGPVITNVFTLVGVGDPAPVGQGCGFAADCSAKGPMTTSTANTPVQSTQGKRLFVGDARPEQVIFREGLLYVARTVRITDWSHGTGGLITNPSSAPLDTSTVLYDLIKTCASGGPTAACGPYSPNGANIGNPAIALETQWFNGQNVPDPAGNITGFGFYSPMFESPANVVTTGPVSPIALFPWLEKLFVGMTTGGTQNVSATFAHSFPSLWDFRPGDDAFDTVEPYLDPYTGNVSNSIACPGSVNVSVLSISGSTATLSSSAGLAVGMFASNFTGAPAGTTPMITAIAGNVITLNFPPTNTTFPFTGTFSATAPNVTQTATTVTSGSPIITLASTTGLVIGGAVTGTTVDKTGTTFAAGSTSLLVPNTTQIAVGMTVTGRTSTVTTNTIAGDTRVNVPNTTQAAVGEAVTSTTTGVIAGGTTIQSIAQDPNNVNNVIVTMSAAAQSNRTGVTLTFDAANLIAANTVVSAPPNVANQVPINNATLFASGPGLVTPGVVGSPGVTIRFSSTAFVPANTTIINISGNTVTLSAPITIPGAAAGSTSNNVPLSFAVLSQACPLIPWSSRGGASTDPNDGSLWLYGQFAKNRISTIPGPGIWGTSVANYALSFPATDPYGNDNTYFTDVPPPASLSTCTGASCFFTWIQIAKNIGLTQTVLVPAVNGVCGTGGVTPILQPPAAGTTPVAGTSALVCPAFGPDATVTRSEMARWVVLSQMDEQQVSAFLAASGGDPTTDPSHLTTFGDAIGDPNRRYIEVMGRRGYTKGCATTTDPTGNYCPTLPVTRAQMAVFLIRAKMNNVFPTTLSGVVSTSGYGDNFGLFTPTTQYFTDVNASDATFGQFALYINKMRELRITNGKGAVSTFLPGDTLTRKEIATFVVRAFFL
jgi:hypothetical protein